MFFVGARFPFTETQVLEVSCSTTGAGGVLCRAGVPVCMLLLAARSTAVLRYFLEDLLLLLLIGGDGLQLLCVVVERFLGPLCSFTGRSNLYTLV